MNYLNPEVYYAVKYLESKTFVYGIDFTIENAVDFAASFYTFWLEEKKGYL